MYVVVYKTGERWNVMGQLFATQEQAAEFMKLNWYKGDLWWEAEILPLGESIGLKYEKAA